MFSMCKKTKTIRSLAPTIRFCIFDVLIRPILTYGNDTWGFDKSGTNALDKVALNYYRCVLSVIATTCYCVLLCMGSVVGFLRMFICMQMY